MADAATRCGFVALVGKPNVGKSTLVNALVGEKISIVTPKPQTTRHRILGVCNWDDTQVLLVDTPGLQRSHTSLMEQTMNRNAEQSAADADVVLWVTDTGGLNKADRFVLERVARSDVPIIAVLNKIDTVRAKSRLLPMLQELNGSGEFEAVVPVSARQDGNLDALKALLIERMPTGPWLYPEDQRSDRGDHFRAGEVLREKLLMGLDQEVPYGLSVEIEKFERAEEGLEIAAVVWVSRESHKPIVIGRGGERVKDIGRRARLALREQFGAPVHLTIWVKVRKNWADSERSLRELGYDLGT